MNRYIAFRALIALGAIFSVVMPFIWAINLSVKYDLTLYLIFLAYRPEFLSVIPNLVILLSAWFFQQWSVLGLLIMAVLFPILKLTFGGASYGAWAVSSTSFIIIALYLKRILVKQYAA